MKSSEEEVADLQQFTRRDEKVCHCEGVLHHNKAQVTKYKSLGFVAGKEYA